MISMIERKDIISEYEQTGSIRAVARNLGIHRKTVKNYVNEYLEAKSGGDETLTAYLKSEPSYKVPQRDRTVLTGEVRALIDRILGPLGRRIDEASPMVNARLPQGHRVNAVVPPIALDGPYLTIRKFTERAMMLSDMQAVGSFDEHVARFLAWTVRCRKNVAVCGGTGSGKTTLLNALSCVISPDGAIRRRRFSHL